MIGDSWAGKRIAVYARYSSENQHETSLDDQLHRARQYAERHQGVIDDGLLFRDAARSGVTLQRPAFQEMMKAVEDLRVDVILTEDVSRLSRDMSDAAYIFKRLAFREVVLIGIADGLDTRQQGAKVLFSMRAMFAELYVDDVRYKTKRGLEGRAREHLATGGRLLGYRTVPAVDAKGDPAARTVIHEEGRALVNRIFSEYAAGHSLLNITRHLNLEGAAILRPARKDRKPGWVASTIRAILHNEAYVGRWKFMRKEYRRNPETGKRRCRKRDPSGIIIEHRPELQIVDDALWNAVQARLSAVRMKYAGSSGAPKGRAVPGRTTAHPFSGLLVCACCQTPMVIAGGSPNRIYRCGDRHKRGMCENRLPIQERFVRRAMLDALNEHIASPWAVAYIRKRFAETIGDTVRNNEEELRKHRSRLTRIEQRLRGFVDMWADGMRGDEVRTAWEDAKTEMQVARATIAVLEGSSNAPIHLPTPAEVEDRILSLRRLCETAPVEAREVLRRVFDGRITMQPQADGTYLAKTEILPLVFVGPETTKPQSGEPDWGFVYFNGCAGRI